MRKIALGLVMSMSIDTASAEILKMNCFAKEAGVTTILEIDNVGKNVRSWAKFDSGHVNGPFGPYAATITPGKIQWIVNNSVGRAIGITTNTIDRKKKSLDVKIYHGPDEDAWRRLNTPCEPA